MAETIEICWGMMQVVTSLPPYAGDGSDGVVGMIASGKEKANYGMLLLRKERTL